jgi:hypothetical protein
VIAKILFWSLVWFAGMSPCMWVLGKLDAPGWTSAAATLAWAVTVARLWDAQQ